MQLTTIILHGFKSFAEKTELQVLPGITAIVGPNGCGKSNISEAVRWALGEQSPKSLRGHRMEDVIFHGSASRKPLGLAEVRLVFSNDGALSVPWGEVQVSRRLYRTGESEYLLNKNLCRLRDVLDLFVGTGVNPKAYALMDQERLNHVLTSRPLERRVLIEEAAGISRYKQQRAETRGKLDAARQNLLRVKDVMDEVKRQLSSLERQARRAQQYKAIQAEKQSLAIALVAAEHAGLRARERALAERMSRLRREEEAARTKLAGLAAREATQQTRIQESEHRLADLRQAVQKIQGELERLLERREQLGVQLRELAAEDLRLQEEARLIAERGAALSAELDAKARLLAETLDEHRRRAEEVEACAARLGALQRDLQAAREQIEALRLEQLRVAGERSEITRAIGELREREHQLLRRHERLVGELAQCRGEAGELAERRDRLEAEAARARGALAAIAEERGRLESALAECEARRAEEHAILTDLRLALAAQQSSLDALERLEREREGYGEAVRLVLSGAGGASVRGVVGTVADLLDVPGGLESAVEALLGERLTWVVVERFEDAKGALAFLNQRKAGPATFLPLETLPATDGLPDPQDGLRWAARLVGSAHPKLLHYLLDRVAVVTHLAEAEALWRRNGSPATYVTLAGEVLSATGRLTGGRGARDGSGLETSLLARKRAIRDGRVALDGLEREVGQAQARAERVEAELQNLRSRLAALLESTHREEVRCLGLDQDLARAATEGERLARHLETLSAEERQVLAELQETRRARANLDAQVEAARRREEALAQASAGISQAIERLEGDERALLEMLTAAQVASASLGERVEGLKRELAQLEETARDLEARLAQSRDRRQQLAGRTSDLELERERADHLAREVAADRDRQESAERSAVAGHQLLLDELREVQAHVQGDEHEMARARDALHAAELEATEGRVRREELEQEARRSFGLEPAVLAQQYDPHLELDAARGRLAELEARLAALGPVNLVADEEYRELEERLIFLGTEHDDLIASIKDLEKALRGMTRTAHERFQEAFEAINRHFGEIFSRLFEGGQAELRLVPGEEGDTDPLETGVDLMAQPRGKRLQSVSLLSGGEKALTGLALLFAIFYYRPSPFCILDEVDAPLDDANIQRFLRVLRELGRQTQFVVITHNRKTMEAADVLYGITMEEPGLSRLVSVKLIQALA
ncbi:MAG: chromosome segregation protein SMC [Candidatus Rokubacteria bacterium]|nr:chromosome segregation protein SMC [Candidatus Rokubacteria bacterium]